MFTHDHCQSTNASDRTPAVASKYLLATATRFDRRHFWTTSALGRSLRQIPEPLRPHLAIAFGNEGPTARGLGVIYNAAITEAISRRLRLILCHDDVWIHDPLFLTRLDEAMHAYDVVGVAGSVGTGPFDVSWLLESKLVEGRIEFNGKWISRLGFSASGIVSHGKATEAAGKERDAPPVYAPSVYGPIRGRCSLLDGVFIACSTVALSSRACRFDEHPDLAFHLYDLDFCRQLGTTGLSLGTWPIAITHESGGNFSSDAFQKASANYLQKWARYLEGSAVADEPPAQRAVA